MRKVLIWRGNSGTWYVDEIDRHDKDSYTNLGNLYNSKSYAVAVAAANYYVNQWKEYGHA